MSSSHTAALDDVRLVGKAKGGRFTRDWRMINAMPMRETTAHKVLEGRMVMD